MATRSLNVQITGDTRQLAVASRQADHHMDGLGKSATRMGKVMALGFAAAGAAAAGALVVGLKKSIDAAMDAEKSQARLQAQLKASGISYRAHAREIDTVIQKHSQLAGLDDEDLQDAFTNIVRVTGDVNKSMKLVGLAADFARAKHMDVAKAGELVGKVAGGNTGILKRYGVQIKEGASATEALGEFQKKFAGQAEAYGKTAAGAQERFGVAVENLQEKLGSKLLPVFTDVTNKVATFVGQMESGKGAGGRFADRISEGFEKVKAVAAAVWPVLRDGGLVAISLLETGFKRLSAIIEAVTPTFLRVKDAIGTLVGWLRENVPPAFDSVKGAVTGAFNAVKGAVASAVEFVRGWIDKHRDDIAAFGHAWENIAKVVGVAVGALVLVVKAQIEHVLIPVMKVALDVVKAVWPSIKKVIEGALQAIGGIIEVFSGIFTLDFKRAWEGIKDIFGGALKIILGLVKGAGTGLLAAAKGLGGLLKDGIVAGLKGLASLLKDALSGAVEWLVDHPPHEMLLDVGKKVASGVIDGLGSLGHMILDKLTAALGWVADKAKGLARGVGKVLGLGDGIGDGVGFISGGGGGTASLMGADPDLFPIVQAGGSFGLHTTSGLRPGSITSSGNVSYHSSGDAVDEAGSPGNMLRFFNYMKRTAGSRLRELIYTPGGVGIKDGRPFRYTGQVAADHFDHVHVAYTGPFGDGIGQAVSAARGAGFRGQDLINMVAIAGAESGYIPTRQNLKYPDHSIGLWQINQLAHHGRFGSDAQLKNPATNARAAYQLFKASGYSPWSTWPTAARGYLARARAAVSGGGGSSGGGSSPPKRGSSVAAGADGKPREQPLQQATRIVGGVRVPVEDTLFNPWSPKGIKGLPEEMQPAPRETSTVADVQAGGGAIGSLIAELAANTAAIKEQREQYERLIAEDYRSKYNVSQSQYAVLAQAIADVANGQIGQRLGLGLSGMRAPAGSVARA